MSDELGPQEAHALAREHGGSLCFISNDQDDHQSADIAVLSYWESGRAEIVVLRIQNEENNLVITLRQRDLDWMVGNGPMPLLDEPK